MRIGSETLKARVAEIEQVLMDEAQEALVVFSNGSALGAQSKVHGYTRYLTNFDSHNTSSVLVLRPGHAPSLVIAINPSRVNKARELLWFSDLRVVKLSAIGPEVAAILNPNLDGKRRIGVIGRSEIPAAIWTPLAAALKNAEWVDFAPHIDKRRIAKTDLQLSFHRRAAEICDAIFQTVQRDVRKAPKGYQLQAAMENAAREEGCEYCQAWLTIAPRADYARFFVEECGRVPQQGDQVIPGIYLTYDGHWGHAIRTGTVGKPTTDHRKIYGIVREMQEAFLAKLKPGEDLREAVAAVDHTVDKYYPDPDFPRSRPGHGLGLSYEDPVVTNAFIHSWDRGTAPPPGDNRIELIPGMLMESHPSLFVPGVAGAMIGDMVTITDTGYEILTDYPRDLIEY
jgi:Xaa-Pro dipeptidase